MADLPTRLAATPAPQALRLAGEAVARRWLAAVVTVFGQPPFQFLYPRLQHGVLRQHHLQLLALLAYEAREFGDPVVWRHAAMLRLLRKCD